MGVPALVSNFDTFAVVARVPVDPVDHPFNGREDGGANLRFEVNAFVSPSSAAGLHPFGDLDVVGYWVGRELGFDQLSFAIVGILAIEAGLLTPPFGLLVYTVKAAVEDPSVGVQRIFLSSVPYWFIMLGTAVLLILFPQIANWLPQLLM